MYTLIFDGTFIAQRNRNAAGFTFLTNPERDRSELLESLCNSLALEVRRFGPLVHNVVWCLDYSSWRKKHKVVMPLETEKAEDEQDYKANRDHSDYDAAKFFSVVDEFTKMLSGVGVIVLKQYGSEADDSSYISSRAIEHMSGKSILISSDGDYKSFVNPNTVLYKLPKREFYFDVSTKPSDKQDLMSAFSQKVDYTQHLVETVDPKIVCHYVNPMEFVFEQAVRGQAKDNIPPMFFWKSKSGTRTFRPSWKHMTKACEALGFGITQISVKEMYDEKWMKRFIIELLTVTKQERDVDHSYKVFRSSLTMAHVSKTEIPTEVWESCKNEFVKEISEKKIDIKVIKSGQQILNSGNVAPATTQEFFGNLDLGDVSSMFEQ